MNPMHGFVRYGVGEFFRARMPKRENKHCMGRVRDGRVLMPTQIIEIRLF